MKHVSAKWTTVILLSAAIMLTGCASEKSQETESIETNSKQKESKTRIVTDSAGREVEIPEKVESIVCLNVGTLRYTCYMQAQNMVIGVEEYEQEKSISRPYNYINYDHFSELPVIGANGEHYAEEIIDVSPDVIMMSAYDDSDADGLQEKTGIPVILVSGSDAMMDEGAYETFRIMGEVYGNEDRSQELITYMDEIKADLDNRTKKVPQEEKPGAYVCGVNFKGMHGFEGTEAGYGPLQAINANNLADETGQKGPFDMDLEQVLAWNPDVLFVDFSGLDLIKKDYKKNPDYYTQLAAVQNGKVYSQIPFRSSASHLETALADTYYAGTILYPEQFADIDPIQQTDVIFKKLLGTDFYETLKENGYEFRQIQIGQE